jgi:hypothetical protein
VRGVTPRGESTGSVASRDNRTKDQIKDAPEFDQDIYRDDSYRGELGIYYGKGGAGYKARRDELI